MRLHLQESHPGAPGMSDCMNSKLLEENVVKDTRPLFTGSIGIAPREAWHCCETFWPEAVIL